MAANSEEHEAILEDWHDLALDYIDDYTFARARPGSKASKSFPDMPHVTVKGAGFDPIPFSEETMDRRTLSEWVNYNQFMPVSHFGPYTAHALKQSGFVVVTLVIDSVADSDGASKAKEQFSVSAKALRSSGVLPSHLYAILDCSEDGNTDYVDHEFPLVGPKVAGSLPRVFAFQGETSYWEDPGRVQADIKKEAIEELLRSIEAFHDGSMLSVLKEYRKRYTRFASSGLVYLIIAVAVPVLALTACCVGMKSLFGGGAEDGAEAGGAPRETKKDK